MAPTDITILNSKRKSILEKLEGEIEILTKF